MAALGGHELVGCRLEWANWMVSRIFLADVGKNGYVCRGIMDFSCR